jgi:hypothetical protein
LRYPGVGDSSSGVLSPLSPEAENEDRLLADKDAIHAAMSHASKGDHLTFYLYELASPVSCLIAFPIYPNIKITNMLLFFCMYGVEMGKILGHSTQQAATNHLFCEQGKEGKRRANQKERHPLFSSIQ